MIFVNFKTYPESTGENAVKLALACEIVSERTGVPIIPIVQAIDLWRVTQHVHIPIWIQHIDPYEPGIHNGFITIESAIAAGAAGTLLNHSEHPLEFAQLEKTVKRVQEVDKEFSIMICAPDIETIQKVKNLHPTYIAYEPPELIASTTDSVATKHSDVIVHGVEAAQPVPLIVGAGVKNTEDIRVSMGKGARGVLVSSAIVLSEKPEEKLHELTEGFKNS